MYVSPKMLASKYGCCVVTVSRIAEEAKATGNYPTIIRRAGKHKEIDDEQYEHYAQRRTYGKKN